MRTLADLNNHLFAQIETLGDEDLSGDALMEEVRRSKALANLSLQVIANARLAYNAYLLQKEDGDVAASAPAVLGIENEIYQ